MDNITLPRQLVNQILAHAQSQPNDEVCGLIGSLDRIPYSTYPIKNVASDTQNLYRMDPREQIDAMRHMRDSGEELFAIYHSHPHSEACPSATDLREATYPDAIYLIISLNTLGVLEIRAFRLRENHTTEVHLEIEH
ncbi:MAG: M67 family metallopeptidase [Gammaproteobacteria bacterium]|nr:M67 family metallopeptidase [Gammaproteobacteria bacterium]